MENEVKVLCIKCYKAKKSKCPDRLTCHLANYDDNVPYYWGVFWVDGECIKDTGALACVVEKLSININTKKEHIKKVEVSDKGKWDF